MSDEGLCLLLDRDGVINELLPGAYVTTPEEFVFREGVIEGLAKLTGVCTYFFIVTNQQGIGKGLMTEADLEAIHSKMLKAIVSGGGKIDGIYHCPHLAADHCRCRKPADGMVRRLFADFPDSATRPLLLIGDGAVDLSLGSRIRANCYGMRHQHNSLEDWSDFPHLAVSDFSQFADRVLSDYSQ
ncbi:MAG: Histidine biosynthesis bifunctional protein HisB [Saprospiraceae bacterium]|jgi:D-glycero-D-manno-heptose 1,7-bisphosphate phosphatase|nr:HAD-IIIA family hydrolase [Saprospiraceae bacterium]MBV6473919.1 Histidine biosynthesis bifunctional protein HisB [Saprospiraceae bacterium]